MYCISQYDIQLLFSFWIVNNSEKYVSVASVVCICGRGPATLIKRWTAKQRWDVHPPEYHRFCFVPMRQEVASLIQKSFAAFLASRDDEESETDYLQAWVGMQQPWTREGSWFAVIQVPWPQSGDQGNQYHSISSFSPGARCRGSPDFHNTSRLLPSMTILASAKCGTWRVCHLPRSHQTQTKC